MTRLEKILNCKIEVEMLAKQFETEDILQDKLMPLWDHLTAMGLKTSTALYNDKWEEFSYEEKNAYIKLIQFGFKAINKALMQQVDIMYNGKPTSVIPFENLLMELDGVLQEKARQEDEISKHATTKEAAEYLKVKIDELRKENPNLEPFDRNVKKYKQSYAYIFSLMLSLLIQMEEAYVDKKNEDKKYWKERQFFLSEMNNINNLKEIYYNSNGTSVQETIAVKHLFSRLRFLTVVLFDEEHSEGELYFFRNNELKKLIKKPYLEYFRALIKNLKSLPYQNRLEPTITEIRLAIKNASQGDII